ncbi:MAG: hypothetical protein WC661_14715 [Opitutaceae bacterium]|jgi:hypothetical protein
MPISPNQFWSKLDGIAVINLDDRPDRWADVEAEAHLLAGGPGLTRVPAVRGSALAGYGQRPWFRGKASDKRWAARVGCTQSHRKVMEFAREKGWGTFLVLEDDADLKPLAQLDFDALHDALFTAQADWDVCYLGFSKSVGASLELASFPPHQLCEMTGCYTTHAYLVRAHARDWIINHLPEDAQAWGWHAQHRIIDRWYVRHLSRSLKVCAVSPSVIAQRAGFSDIVQRQVDYADEFSGRVSGATRSRANFTLRKNLSNIGYMIGDGYDALRGLAKRINGF